MVPASSGGPAGPGSVALPAPIAAAAPIQVDQHKKFPEKGSICMILLMIFNKISFGSAFAFGGAHSMLACGGLLGTHGAYHPEVVQEMRRHGWALIGGNGAAPPRNADLRQWGKNPVRGAAAHLLAEDEFTSALGFKIAPGVKLTGALHGSGGAINASGELARLARASVVMSSSGARDSYVPLFLANDWGRARNDSAELGGRFDEVPWALAESISCKSYAAPWPLSRAEREVAHVALARALLVDVGALRTAHTPSSREGAGGVKVPRAVSRKGSSCRRVEITEADVEANAAARERGGIAATLRHRSDDVGAAFETRTRGAERRRAPGGLALVKAPNDLCCTGDGGGSGGEESSYIEDELTHAGDGVGGLMFDFMAAAAVAGRSLRAPMVMPRARASTSPPTPGKASVIKCLTLWTR